MARTETELRLARDRLKRAMALLAEEVAAIEVEMSAIKGDIRLDRAFFWNYVVKMLFDNFGGLSSSVIYENLTARGLRVSQNGLRVFLSRYRDRGNLLLIEKGGEVARWRLSPSVVERALKLGYARREE